MESREQGGEGWGASVKGGDSNGSYFLPCFLLSCVTKERFVGVKPRRATVAVQKLFLKSPHRLTFRYDPLCLTLNLNPPPSPSSSSKQGQSNSNHNLIWVRRQCLSVIRIDGCKSPTFFWLLCINLFSSWTPVHQRGTIDYKKKKSTDLSQAA